MLGECLSFLSPGNIDFLLLPPTGFSRQCLSGWPWAHDHPPRLGFPSAEIDCRCVPPRTAYDFYVFILFFFGDKDQALGLAHASWVGALPAQLHPSAQQLIFRAVIAVHSDEGGFMDLLQGSLSLPSSSPARPSPYLLPLPPPSLFLPPFGVFSGSQRT